MQGRLRLLEPLLQEPLAVPSSVASVSSLALVHARQRVEERLSGRSLQHGARQVASSLAATFFDFQANQRRRPNLYWKMGPCPATKPTTDSARAAAPDKAYEARKSEPCNRQYLSILRATETCRQAPHTDTNSDRAGQSRLVADFQAVNLLLKKTLGSTTIQLFMAPRAHREEKMLRGPVWSTGQGLLTQLQRLARDLWRSIVRIRRNPEEWNFS